MPLTSSASLRTRIVETLLLLPNYQGRRSDVLQLMEARYEGIWSEEDLSSPATRPHETKWRNNASFERARMVREGLLSDRADGVWELSSSGERLANLPSVRHAKWLADEIARRELMWTAISKLRAADGTVTASNTREVGIYSGARGVYADRTRTRTVHTPDGVAVSLHHTGLHYADELTNEGLVYHFPNTLQPSHDASDIQAIRNAHTFAFPVFVITYPPRNPKRREVFRGTVEAIDERVGTALITFWGDEELPPAPDWEEAQQEFSLMDEDEQWIVSRRRARPNQARFAFELRRRYPDGCVACGQTEPVVLEGAHLRPKSRLGSDDPRNGLLLCSNHHKMFDAFLWTIDPHSYRFLCREAKDLGQLGFTREAMREDHPKPAPKALHDAYERWETAQKQL